MNKRINVTRKMKCKVLTKLKPKTTNATQFNVNLFTSL